MEEVKVKGFFIEPKYNALILYIEYKGLEEQFIFRPEIDNSLEYLISRLQNRLKTMKSYSDKEITEWLKNQQEMKK